MRASRAWPRLSLIVMDPLRRGGLACSLTTKRTRRAPGYVCAQEQHRKMAGDNCVVRLICSSGGDTQDFQWPLSRSDKSRRQREGCDWIRGKYRKVFCLYFLMSYLFFAHYNIQLDIVSGRPCVTPVRNHGIHV